jgi:2-dehydro-3-deoxyphosphogluconate aldolase/(4S)-4-hydroxy-2-oxoglutarate aldolase
VIPVLERIRAERVVAILRRVPDPDALVDALAAGGVGVVEITLDSIGALAAIRRLRARGDVSVLAGTVRTAAQAEAAIEAGAEACVGPGLVLEVVERCRAVGIPVVPGALTPTEVDQAWGLGASLVKLFPASLGGPRYLRELLAPLAEVPVMPTGGIDARNLRDYLDAGAVAVGMGSVFTRAEDPEAAARQISALARA